MFEFLHPKCIAQSATHFIRSSNSANYHFPLHAAQPRMHHSVNKCTGNSGSFDELLRFSILIAFCGECLNISVGIQDSHELCVVTLCNPVCRILIAFTHIIHQQLDLSRSALCILRTKIPMHFHHKMGNATVKLWLRALHHFTHNQKKNIFAFECNWAVQ